jgi:5'-nucleotidase
MHILLTNDDGIQAPGLLALHNRFEKDHSVTVIAPDREQSAVGHAITLSRPLRATRVSMNGNRPAYAVSGTPADCVKLGVLELLESKPDMLISGINPGANVGVNVNYSGTVAAAKEAALYGIPAMAVSRMGPATDQFDDAAAFVAKLACKVAANGLPFGTFLNVNIPNLPIHEVGGIRVSKLSIKFFPETIEKRIDPRNRTYYWQGRDALPVSDNPEIDGTALSDAFISITPITCDVTDYHSMAAMKRWGLESL